MTKIEAVVEDGFSLSLGHRELTDLALLSLRTALKAYFSTYRAMKGRLSHLKGNISGLPDEIQQLVADYHHDPEYCEAYSEVIFHFHHFVELTIKELLRREHPLLATDASRKPSIFFRMLMKENIDQIDQRQLKSIEFQRSLERLYALVKNEQLSDYRKLRFVVDSKHWLESLNKLRNEIAHRGTYIIRYSSLDMLVGQFILPFVLKALKLPIYSSSDFDWRYKRLNCRADLMVKIAEEVQRPKPSTSRIALLKELGRAAYENPLPRGPLRKQTGLPVMDHAEKSATEKAESLGMESDVIDTRICPVCGVKSLLLYANVRGDQYFDEASGEVHVDYKELYIYAVECLCCSFEIGDEIGEDSFAGLRIKSYWRVEKLVPQ